MSFCADGMMVTFDNLTTTDEQLESVLYNMDKYIGVSLLQWDGTTDDEFRYSCEYGQYYVYLGYEDNDYRGYCAYNDDISTAFQVNFDLIASSYAISDF